MLQRQLRKQKADFLIIKKKGELQMVKIRLHGLLEDIQLMAQDMKNWYKVVQISEPYKDRGQSEFYRIYVTVMKGI